MMILKNNAEVWSNILTDFIFTNKALIILPLMIISYISIGLPDFLKGQALTFTLLLFLFPLKTTLNKNGVNRLFINTSWKKIRYYKTKKRSVIFYDSNKDMKYEMAFFYQKSLEAALKKYCKPLK